MGLETSKCISKANGEKINFSGTEMRYKLNSQEIQPSSNPVSMKHAHLHLFMLQQTMIHYHDDGPPPTEVMFHPHQNGHHLHDHHQERTHVLKSVLAHQKNSHPHGSPWNIMNKCKAGRALDTACAM
jgi:hypothetical protein